MLAPLNVHEIGSKSHARAAIEFNYTNEAADWSYQRFQVTVYLRDMPHSGNFTLCEQKIEPLGCYSGVSAWVNPIRQDPNTLWVSYNLHFLVSQSESNGKLIAHTNNYISEQLLVWNDKKPFVETSTYRMGSAVIEERLSIRVYRL